MKQLLKEGIRRLFIANRGPGNRDLGIILRDAKAGSDEAFQILQQKLADIGVSLKNKADLMNEEVVELNAALDDGINFVSEYFQKLTGGGMDAPLKKGGIVGYKKGGVVRGLDAGIHKNVRLI